MEQVSKCALGGLILKENKQNQTLGFVLSLGKGHRQNTMEALPLASCWDHRWSKCLAQQPEHYLHYLRII